MCFLIRIIPKSKNEAAASDRHLTFRKIVCSYVLAFLFLLPMTNAAIPAPEAHSSASHSAMWLLSPVWGVVGSVGEEAALTISLVSALPSSKLTVTVWLPVDSFCRVDAFSVITVLPDLAS